MTYKNKPIFRPSGDAYSEMIGKIYQILFAATETATKEIGCTGVSFVTGALSVWMFEMRDMDAKATSKLFKALSVLSDPSSTHNQKVAAERRRRQACEQLFRSTELQMATEDATEQ